MLKALIAVFVAIFLYKFILWVISDSKEQKAEEKANTKIKEKRGILKSFARKNVELDLDEEIHKKQTALDKRKEELDKILPSDKEQE